MMKTNWKREASLIVFVSLLASPEPCRSFMSTSPVPKVPDARSSASLATSSALFSATQNYTCSFDSFLVREEKNYQEEIRRHGQTPDEKAWEESWRLAEEARFQGQKLRGGHNERWLAEGQYQQSRHQTDHRPETSDFNRQETERVKAEYSRKLAEEARRQGEVLDGGIFDGRSQAASRVNERRQQAEEVARLEEERRRQEDEKVQARIADQRRREEQARMVQCLNGGGRGEVLINGGGFFTGQLNPVKRVLSPEQMRLAKEAAEEQRRQAEAYRIAEELRIEHEMKTRRLQEEIEYCQKLTWDALKQELSERGIEARFRERWEYVLAVAKARDAEGYTKVSEVEVLTDDEEVGTHLIAEADDTTGSQSSKGAASSQMPPITPPYSYSQSPEGSSNGKSSYDWETYGSNAGYSYEHRNPPSNRYQNTDSNPTPYTAPAPQNAFHMPYTTQGAANEESAARRQRPNNSYASANHPQNSPFSKGNTARPSDQTTGAYNRHENAFNSPFTQGSQGAAAASRSQHHQTSQEEERISRTQPVQPYSPRFSNSLYQDESTGLQDGLTKMHPFTASNDRNVGGGSSSSRQQQGTGTPSSPGANRGNVRDGPAPNSNSNPGRGANFVTYDE